MLIHGVWLKQ